MTPTFKSNVNVEAAEGVIVRLAIWINHSKYRSLGWSSIVSINTHLYTSVPKLDMEQRYIANWHLLVHNSCRHTEIVDSNNRLPLEHWSPINMSQYYWYGAINCVLHLQTSTKYSYLHSIVQPINKCKSSTAVHIHQSPQIKARSLYYSTTAPSDNDDITVQPL